MDNINTDNINDELDELEELERLEREELEKSNSINNSLGTDNLEEDLPPLEIKDPPGFLRFFPIIIKQIAEQGVQFKMETDGFLYVEGFYRNGSMKIDFEGDKIIAIDKRGRKTEINSFDDLVLLNYDWWRASNSRGNYVMPERPWIDKFIEKKKVKRKVIYEPIDEIEKIDDEI